MKLSSVIGSILLFKPSGIDEGMIHDIAFYSKSVGNFNFHYTDISSVIYNLDNYDEYFKLKGSKIMKTDYYEEHVDIFKYRFFDVLSEKEKMIIYKIISLI